MGEFLNAFADVFFYPVNPEYFSSFDENPVMTVLCVVLLGIGISGITRKLFEVLFL